MGRTTSALLPATERLAQELGERLRLARLRRKLTALQVCERAGMAPMTLRALERGSTGATLGAYLSVMQVLGIQNQLGQVAKEDPLGRTLQDIQLKKTKRMKSLEPLEPHELPPPTYPDATPVANVPSVADAVVVWDSEKQEFTTDDLMAVLQTDVSDADKGKT